MEKIREFKFPDTFKDFNKAESIPSVFYFLSQNNEVFIFFF